MSLDFKYYILNNIGEYYSVDRFNTITTVVAPVPLTDTPKGWESILCGIEKSDKYKGTFSKISTPLNFVGDGKLIIDYILLNEGPGGYAKLKIETKDKAGLGYVTLFDGKIDLQQPNVLESATTANIRENNLTDILEAKDDVVYEIILDGSNSVDVQLDGVTIIYNTEFLVTGEAYNDNAVVALNEISSENSNTVSTSMVNYGAFPASVPATNEPFYFANESASLVFNYDFQCSGNWNLAGTPPPPNPASAFSFSILIEYAAGGFLDTVIYSVSGAGPVYATHNITGTNTLAVSPGDRVYLCCNLFPTNDRLFIVVNYDPTMNSEFSVKSGLRKNPTLHKGILTDILWNELIKKASVNEYTGISYILNNSDHVLLPGSALRNETVVSIKTSIKKFLQYCYVNHLAVLNDDSGNVANIGSYLECFDNSNELTNLGTVSGLQLNVDNSVQYTSIKVGYENIDIGINIANGKDEFNQTNYFTTGIVGGKNEYDITSPYIASMYAIELMRTKFSNKKTTDYNKDNEVYILKAQLGINQYYYSGAFKVIAGNKIVIPASLITISNGIALSISGTGAVDGAYTITGTSYTTNGETEITVSSAIAAGTYTYGYFAFLNSSLYGPLRLSYSTITGLLDPATAYNIELSPARLLRLHAPILASSIYNISVITALNSIKFQSGDKNTLLTTDDGVTVIAENADLPLTGISTYYLPFLVNFTTDYDIELYKKFNLANKYKYVSFVWNKTTFKGFVKSLQINPESGKSMTFTLNLAANQNLLNFSKRWVG
jgi:hypothetical protein